MSLLAADDVVPTWTEARGAAREPLLVLEPLQAYLTARGLARGRPSVVALGEGLSNATFLLGFTDGARLVLRRPPRGPLAPSAHDVLREAEVMGRLALSPVPVPRILDVCDDDDVIGAPFYLMEHLPGEVPVTSLPVALRRPDRRRRYGELMAETLAAIHSVDLAAVGLEHLGRPSGYLERQVARHRQLWELYRTRRLPAVGEVADWLEANLPARSEVTLVHGDFHPANVMIDPDAPARTVAVLDWELATRGDPLADLGYLCALWPEAAEPEHPLERGPLTRGPGSLSRAELLSHYAAVSGRAVAGHGWYEVLALWRAAIFTEGNLRRVRTSTADMAFLRGGGEPAERLAGMALARMRDIESGG